MRLPEQARPGVSEFGEEACVIYINTPIIALTANCSPEYREQCIQQGLQGFLAKPVQSTELLKAVEAFLPAPKGPVSPPQRTASIAV